MIPASAVVHQCPGCQTWATFNCYPAIPEAPERWLCKWCGYYWSALYGVRQCVPDLDAGVWNFREYVRRVGPTPRQAYEQGHHALLHAMAPVVPRPTWALDR